MNSWLSVGGEFFIRSFELALWLQRRTGLDRVQALAGRWNTSLQNKNTSRRQYGNSRPGYGIAQKNDLSTE